MPMRKHIFSSRNFYNLLHPMAAAVGGINPFHTKYTRAGEISARSLDGLYSRAQVGNEGNCAIRVTKGCCYLADVAQNVFEGMNYAHCAGVGAQTAF